MKVGKLFFVNNSATSRVTPSCKARRFTHIRHIFAVVSSGLCMEHFRHPFPCILGFQFFSSAALFDRFCTDCDHDAKALMRAAYLKEQRHDLNYTMSLPTGTESPIAKNRCCKVGLFESLVAVNDLTALPVKWLICHGQPICFEQLSRTKAI